MRTCIYVLSCPDYAQHHLDDTINEQHNGGIPLKTQQRITMALKLFPEADIKVLFADSEVLHEGKHEDEEAFLKAINTSCDRVKTKYPEVEVSTFFNLAGSRERFTQLVDMFYRNLYYKLEKPEGKRLSQTLQYDLVGTEERLKARKAEVPDSETLKHRILRNSFAEMLAVGELLRSESTPTGLCPNIAIYDQSVVTGLINDGDKYGSVLKKGLAPLPLILANSASTV